VRSIQVICVFGVVTVGGVISGPHLPTGSIIILSLNGGTGYDVTLLGVAERYVFPTTLALSSSYVVAIETPLSQYNCTLFNASGMVTDHVTNANIICIGLGCSDGPTIPPNGGYPTDCDQRPDGYRCVLTCEGGYNKTGDAICLTGSWTSPACQALPNSSTASRLVPWLPNEYTYGIIILIALIILIIALCCCCCKSKGGKVNRRRKGDRNKDDMIPLGNLEKMVPAFETSDDIDPLDADVQPREGHPGGVLRID